MVALVEYWLAVFGLANAIVFLHVGRPVRESITGVTDEEFRRRMGGHGGGLSSWRHSVIGRMFRCHACMGFWVGIPLAVLHWGVPPYCPDPALIKISICSSLSASAFNFIVWTVLVKLGADKL